MNQIMCLDCGEFVHATTENGAVVPLKEACPQCGGVEFKDVSTDTRTRAE